MNEKLKQLYKDVILKHNNAPFHYEKMAGATHQLEAYNPVCGDKFTVFLTLEEDQIKDISFHGYGCAISKASTSILSKKLLGKSLSEAHLIQETFLKTVEGKIDNPDEEMEAFAAAQSFPGRMKCATLSWDELGLWLKTNME